MESQQNPPPPQEESIFNEADFSMQGYDKHIKNARIMLFVIAGLQFIPLLLLGPVDEETRWVIIGITIFVAAVFAGLAFWTKSKPYPALSTAFIFYLCLLIINGIMDPTTIFQGIILKIIVIILLINGIRNAKEAHELKKTFGR